MALPFRRPRFPPELRDRLRMKTALAGHQVLEEHVRSAVEMVEEGLEHSPIERLLAVYARLHHLDEQDARKLRQRVLAILSQTGTPGGSLPEPRSPFTRIRRRLRGRANPELREWVERHSARVELAIVDLHVRHAIDVLTLLQDHLTADRAVSLYAELLGLRTTTAEMVRLGVFKALHEREAHNVELIHPGGAIQYPLRRVEKDG
jgi:hypothetical protein